MAKKQKPRYPKHSPLGWILRVLPPLLGIGVVIFAMVFFFRVETIVVAGQIRYTSEEITAMTGVVLDDNLIFLDKPTIERRIMQGLPYVESVEISRSLPSTLVITVEECTETIMVVQTDASWRMSYQGKLVERLETTMPEMPYIEGCKLLAPTEGTSIVIEDVGDGVDRKSSLLSLIEAMEDLDMIQELQGIHLGQADMLTLDYASRFTVELLYGVDYSYKLRNLAVVMDSLESNEMGTINLRLDGKANFIPYG